MVFKQKMSESRGSQGESAMGTRRGYNFSNLYQLNKTDEPMNQVKSLGSQLQSSQNAVDTQSTLGKQNAAAGRSPEANTAAIADQVSKAQGMNDKLSGVNVIADAAKAGQSGMQAGMTDFYANGAGVNQAKRPFQGIFSQIQNVAGGYNADIGGIYQQGKANLDKRNQIEIEKQKLAASDLHKRNLQGIQNSRDQDFNRPGTEISRMDDTTWMLKTGRITQDEWARAQNDPEYYNYLVNKFSDGRKQ